MDDFRNEVISAYDSYLYETEGRGASYGELAYIESLDERGLKSLYNEIEKEREKNEKRA